MKQIKESSAFDASAQNKVMDGSFNISKIDDPIELKRLNNYVSTVLSSSAFSHSRKEIMIGLRLKLNLLGFDIDIPKNIDDKGDGTYGSPLKRFGGITGMDDMGEKLDNPHGPGPKLDIEFKSVADILSARIVPHKGGTAIKETASQPKFVPAPPASSPPPVVIKEGFTFAQVKKYLGK